MPEDAIVVRGDRALIAELRKVGKAGVRKAARTAIRDGTKILVRVMRAEMPVSKRKKKWRGQRGDLKRSIGRRAKTYRNTGIVFEVIGPRWPRGAHGHLIELGTKERFYDKRRIRHRTGRILAPQRGPISRAYDKTRHRVQLRIGRRLLSELMREIRKT